MDTHQKPSPVELDETHLFGMVPEVLSDENEPSLASTLRLPLLDSKLSLRSFSPEDIDKSSGISSTVSSIATIDNVQQGTNDKTNTDGELFVPVRSPVTEREGDGSNPSESLQTVVIDIENGEGKSKCIFKHNNPVFTR